MVSADTQGAVRGGPPPRTALSEVGWFGRSPFLVQEVCLDGRGGSRNMQEQKARVEAPWETVDRRRFETKAATVEWVHQLAEWDLFLTITRRGGGWENAMRAKMEFERWAKWKLRRKRILFTVEIHPGGHGAHVHAIAESGGQRYVPLQKSALRHFGRNRIVPARSPGAVAQYVSRRLAFEMTKQWSRGVEWNLINFSTRPCRA